MGGYVNYNDRSDVGWTISQGVVADSSSLHEPLSIAFLRLSQRVLSQDSRPFIEY
jgi:hypothetical protein